MAVKSRFDLTTEQENKQRRNSLDSIGKCSNTFLFFSRISIGNFWEYAIATQCDRILLSSHYSGGIDDLPMEEKEILRKYLGTEEAKQRR